MQENPKWLDDLHEAYEKSGVYCLLIESGFADCAECDKCVFPTPWEVGEC